MLWLNFGGCDYPSRIPDVGFDSLEVEWVRIHIEGTALGKQQESRLLNFLVEVIFRHFNSFARLVCIHLLLWVRAVTFWP